MNKRDQAILTWCEKHRPDILHTVRNIVEDANADPHGKVAQGLHFLAVIAFEAGRVFQAETNAVLGNPNVYASDEDQERLGIKGLRHGNDARE